MQKKDSSPLNFSNQLFVLEQHKNYLENPNLVSEEWQAFFKGMEFSSTDLGSDKNLKILFLINAYKKYGHLKAKTNPLEENLSSPKELDISCFGLTNEDLNTNYPTHGLLIAPDAELSKIIAKLEEIYCGSLGYEFSHLENHEAENLIHQEILKNSYSLNKSESEIVLREWFKAKYLEEFLQKKFLGAKRFSLEGSESFMPLMWQLCDLAANSQIKKGVIGMAHRGRLNILCNLLKKPYHELFEEFNTKIMPTKTFGLSDVKYHKGANSKFQSTHSFEIDLTLIPNPSHLETVDPVALGYARGLHEEALPILVHGDASLAGQGVVYETIQLCGIEGYSNGGTIHVVINNQIGFTASPEESRSTRYCTDIAKAFGAPVIHVNADDPEACIKAARLAFFLRNLLKKDVFIDLIACRVYGHNEADEPRFTNPHLYKKITARGDIYEKLKNKLNLDSLWVNEMELSYKNLLESELEIALKAVEGKEPTMPKPSLYDPRTNVDTEKLEELLEKISFLPKDFEIHPKLQKLITERKEKILANFDSKALDWATAEALAFATLLNNGTGIRLSGEDSKRGTFSHRHAVLFSQLKEETFIPLKSVCVDSDFEVYNSALSEYAVMGYEFGYSLSNPRKLIIWEAQFGDFANGAQIIIDQYLAGSETKWGIRSGLTLFLPHGHEGMGPEHTSCRLERFLELSGMENWQVVYPTTPAQFFHILRLQGLSLEKRPLIVMTPKSMLRLQESFSALNDLSSGSFNPILEDVENEDATRVLLCSGKIYYDLLKARGNKKIAIIRIERLYPFPKGHLFEILKRYKYLENLVWVQEEPMNQGAFAFVREMVGDSVQLQYVGRERIPVPDTGIFAYFQKQSETIIKRAIG
jgi:2-oxoglutarate dehydrogenase E1 component